MSARESRGDELPFVGRERELTQVTTVISNRTRASAALEVSGPAGIGKTRLVREYLMRHQPPTVYWESCRQTAQFGPWSRIAARLRGESSGTLAQIVLADDAFAAVRSDLIEATVEFYREHSEHTPFTVVLDDLHEADADTLLLTRHLARQLDPTRVSIILTVRSSPGDPPLLIDSSVVRLDGLDIESVRQLLGQVELADRLLARTDGNPLHLERLLLRRSLGASVAPLTELIEQQIAELTTESHAVLLTLAVLDRPSTLTDIVTVSHMSETSAGEALATLRTSRLIDGHGSAADPVVLHHGLIGALVVEVADGEAVRGIHQQAVNLLNGAVGATDRRMQHRLMALEANSDASVHEHLGAGRKAARALAADEAVAQFRRAAAALEQNERPAASLVVDVHLALASALRQVRDAAGAESAIDRAWNIAVETGDAVAIAHSALGDGFRFGFAGERGVERARRCELALVYETSLAATVRSRLHAALACHALSNASAASARRHAIIALDLAEAAADDYALGCALVAWIVTDLDPDTLDDRLTAAWRVSSLAETTGAIDLARNSHFLLMACLLERGDVRALDAELASRHRSASTFAELENGRHAAWFRCMRALLDGRIDDAEHLSLVALEAAQRDGDHDALPVHVGQLGILRWLQGREPEVEPYYAAARVEQPHDAVWSAVLARLWALSNRFEAALGALDSIGDLTAVPRDRNWLITMATAAEAAAIVGHPTALPVLRELLLPYSGRLVPIGLGIACWGTVSRPLALVCRALGNGAEAEHFLRSAIRACSAAGAQPWIAQAQLDLAELLREQDAASTEAVTLARSAFATAHALSIVPLRTKADLFLSGLLPVETARPTPSDPQPGLPAVNVLGTFAVIGANGEPAAWTSRKARELLKLLIARYGRVLPREEAIEALWPGSAPADATNRLSVALSTIRRALDPAREFSANAFIDADRRGISVRTTTVTVDVASFRARASSLDEPSSTNKESLVGVSELRAVVDSYTGEAFADEPYSDWAAPVRDSIRSLFIGIAHRLIARLAVTDDDLSVIETCGRILEEDPFDGPAHEAMIRSLDRLGAHGRAARARLVYRDRLTELGLDASPTQTVTERAKRSAS